MAIATASVTTVNLSTDGGGQTFTKPSGLAVGDLMVAIVIRRTGGSPIDPDGIATPSGWTRQNYFGSSDPNPLTGAWVFSKVAESADVSASDFTFTGAAGGVLYRITGAAAARFYISATQHVGSQALAIVFGFTGDGSGSVATYSGYQVTGGATPTFTERIDSSNLTGADISLGIADGVYNSADAITNFNVTFTGSGIDETATGIVIISAQNSPTGTLTTIEIDPTLNDVTGKSGTTGTLDTLEITPELGTILGRGTAPTQWTNETKSNTTWDNEETP